MSGMFKSPSNQQKLVLALPSRDERIFHLRISRNVLVAFTVSVLLHLAVLWFFQPKLFSMGVPKKDAPPLEITLGPPQEKETAPSELVLPEPEQLLTKSIELAPKKPKKTKPPKKKTPTEPPVKVVEKSQITVPIKKDIKKEVPQPVPEKASPAPLPGEDMQAYVRRQQAARLAAQGASKKDVEEVLASNNPVSAGKKRDAKILETLNLNGTNGIFEIRALSRNAAQFSFKGWKNNVNTARLEIINVTAADTVNIKRTVVRKMIEIIRREYSGDFNWDSRRLGRVLKLSARPQDNAALESFMMSEFFGPSSPYR